MCAGRGWEGGKSFFRTTVAMVRFSAADGVVPGLSQPRLGCAGQIQRAAHAALGTAQDVLCQAVSGIHIGAGLPA